MTNVRFIELTEHEYFCTEDRAKARVLAVRKDLRYFGPEVNPDAPEMGAYRKNKFN